MRLRAEARHELNIRSKKLVGDNGSICKPKMVTPIQEPWKMPQEKHPSLQTWTTRRPNTFLFPRHMSYLIPAILEGRCANLLELLHDLRCYTDQPHPKDAEQASNTFLSKSLRVTLKRMGWEGRQENTRCEFPCRI